MKVNITEILNSPGALEDLLELAANGFTIKYYEEKSGKYPFTYTATGYELVPIENAEKS